jgi:hypothetical protein
VHMLIQELNGRLEELFQISHGIWDLPVEGLSAVFEREGEVNKALLERTAELIYRRKSRIDVEIVLLNRIISKLGREALKESRSRQRQ